MREIVKRLFEGDTDLGDSHSNNRDPRHHYPSGGEPAYRLQPRESYGDNQQLAGPTYTNDRSGKLRKAFRDVTKNLGNYFKEELGLEVSEADFTGMEISFGDPHEYQRSKGQASDAGVILGLYDPETNRIIINPIYENDFGKITRGMGFRDGGEQTLPSLERVLAEEVVHGLQRKYGILDLAYKRLGRQRGRDHIEGSAATIAEEALGEPTDIYSREKGQYTDSIGRHPAGNKKRGAFLEPVEV